MYYIFFYYTLFYKKLKDENSFKKLGIAKELAMLRFADFFVLN